MFAPLAVTTDAVSAPHLGSPDGWGLEAKFEIVLANGRRVIFPASIDPGGAGAAAAGSGGRMIAFPAGTKVWIAGGVTDMRCGMNSLALKVQQGLGRDPHAGELFCFRGRKGDLLEILWHDGVGMSLYAKRLEAGKFIWPVSQGGTAVQISGGRSWATCWRGSTGAIRRLDAAAGKGRLIDRISLFSLKL